MGAKLVHTDEMTKVVTAAEAQAKLDVLLDQASIDHQPLLITGSKSNAVLLDEQDWNAIQETIYLLSIPGMRESIEEGLQTDRKDCSTDPGW